MGLSGSVDSTVGEEALQGGTVGEGSPRRERRLLVVGDFRVWAS